jgi:N-succinyldiaminopimelate aminotransferase
LVAAVRAAKQFLTYTSGAPFQLAIARGLSLPRAVIDGFGASLRERRDLFCDGLEALGFTVYRPAATYFATTDIAPVAPGLDAPAFCRALPPRCGVVAIPSSVFYGPGDPGAGRTLVRWAFCKRPEVLEEALDRLASWG